VKEIKSKRIGDMILNEKETIALKSLAIEQGNSGGECGNLFNVKHPFTRGLFSDCILGLVKKGCFEYLTVKGKFALRVEFYKTYRS